MNASIYNASAAFRDVLVASMHTDAAADPDGIGARFVTGQFQLVLSAPEVMSPTQQGLSLHLYRLNVDTSLRAVPPRTPSLVPNLRLVLHYLITPVVNDPQTSQRLLAHTLMTIERQPLLSVQGASAAADTQTLEAVLEDLTLDELRAIGGSRAPVACIAYQVRGVSLVQTPTDTPPIRHG